MNPRRRLLQWCDIEQGEDPLTRPAPAEENAGVVHPLPQGGEGRDLDEDEESPQECRNSRERPQGPPERDFFTPSGL